MILKAPIVSDSFFILSLSFFVIMKSSKNGIAIPSGLEAISFVIPPLSNMLFILASIPRVEFSNAFLAFFFIIPLIAERLNE